MSELKRAVYGHPRLVGSGGHKKCLSKPFIISFHVFFFFNCKGTGVYFSSQKAMVNSERTGQIHTSDVRNSFYTKKYLNMFSGLMGPKWNNKQLNLNGFSHIVLHLVETQCCLLL